MAKKRSSTRAESHRICNIMPSRGTDKDWPYETAIASEAVTAVAAPPTTVDLRAAWWNIGDQEDTGSCVGWASTDGVMRYHLVKAGRLGQKRARVAPRRLDGVEGNGRVRQPPRDIHRGCGHEPEGSDGYLSQVRRRAGGNAAVPHHDQDVHR